MGLTAALITTAVLLLSLTTAVEGSNYHKLKIFNESYGRFKDDLGKYNTIFQVIGPAVINEALQITPPLPQNLVVSPSAFDQSGRILLKKPFKLWKPDLLRVASFNVSFRINIYLPNNQTTAGEGLAFIIAPDLLIPNNSYGQYLGITNSSTDGKPTNQIVAIEFDTVKQEYDLDDNHVGLNINSVISNASVSLTPLGIELAPFPNVAKFYDVWIQYDGVNKTIQVYIAQTSTQTGPEASKPASPVLESPLELRGVVNQNSYFGFAASTGKSMQLNCVLRWNLVVEHYEDEEDNSRIKWILIGVLVSTATLVLIAAGLGYYFFNRRRRGWAGGSNSNVNILGALKSLPGMPREFEFKGLKKATNNFDEKNKLGEGGYGVVYKGYLQSENLEVAVKWFSRESLKGEDDFLSELTIINRLRHKNLVTLRGWCHTNGKLLLVYDYMPNGSLDRHLFGSGRESNPLSWALRYKIISGVSSALHYLHNEYDQRVVHRDLKASNIMLESNFDARLGDFGLARALDGEKTSYAEAEGFLGTMGYIAPECFHTGKATQQSDVYAFGAVLLEVVCGVRPGSKIGGYNLLVDWVWSLHREGRLLEAVDKSIKDDYVVEEAERILLLGLACSHPTASERPKTHTISQIISGSVSVPRVSPFKPAFVWSSSSMGTENDTSQATMTETRSFTSSNYGSGYTPKYSRPDGYSPAAPNSDSFNLV
ncbi:probable L-type lectin-domain containing receptor kinase S.5 [Impatiens glandulifera]|uniref:probable L-type lectin-domain containing receptor kinase S.5 n=1 Tax=Impatiens glandulifera TaxID=253017 RepID=UPI001FB15554|nr:probable L-type lectin-domain containing receptor kinase S.5 [Impatiens glandulifera]